MWHQKSRRVNRWVVHNVRRLYRALRAKRRPLVRKAKLVSD